MATKKTDDTTEAEALPEPEALAEAEPCSHEWKYIERPKAFHNQRCTTCKAERRSNSLT